MSTLLKKKYMLDCRKRKQGEAVVLANDGGLGGCDGRKLLEAAVPSTISGLASSNAANRPNTVRFADETTDIVTATGERHYGAETLQRYRHDIWYTRDDYRTFWKDRIDSVRLWRLVHGDMETGGFDQQYTIRGLENYVYSTSEEVSHQRDLYTKVVLEEQNCDSIREKVELWSAAASDRAQTWALHDVETVSEEEHHRIILRHRRRRHSSMGDVVRSSSSSSADKGSLNPPRSPSSVVVDLTREDESGGGLQDVKEMNKRLIEHMQQQQLQQHSPMEGAPAALPRPKKTRRVSASGQHQRLPTVRLADPQRQCEPSFPRKNASTMDQDDRGNQRRHSMHMTARQGGELQLTHQQSLHHQHRQPRQQRRNSIADDFDRHMSFCDQLLNNQHHHFAQQMHQQHSSAGHYRDALALSVPPYSSSDGALGALPNCGSIRRDSLSHSMHYAQHNYTGRPHEQQLLQHQPHGPTRVESDAAFNGHQTRRDSFSARDYQQMQQCTEARQRQQRMDADYNDCVTTSYSCLRRDSLAGHHL